MERSIELLNVLYQNAEMGLVGIDDVLGKAKNPKLRIELEHEKKEYQAFLKDVKKRFKRLHGEIKPVNMFAKVSSSIYSEMKLMKEDSDEIIIKMMIEGSYKSIGILTTKELEYDTIDEKTKNMLLDFINILNNNIINLKKLSKKI